MDTDIAPSSKVAATGGKRPRRLFTAGQRAELLREYRRGDETQQAFCTRHGIHPTTLSGWLRRSRRNPPAFAEVSVALSAAAPIEVELPNGIRIHVRTGGDLSRTAELIRRVAMPGREADPC